MVLIMTPNNYLVILICSTVFLLSSFVSSQQNGRSIKDPLSFYKYAVSLRSYHPDYYAAIYPGLSAQYNRIIRDSYKMQKMNTRTPTNSKPSKRDTLPKKAATRTVVSVSNIYGPPIVRMPTLSESSATQPVRTNNKISRSLNNIEIPATEAILNYARELPVTEVPETRVQTEWNLHCYLLGYNNSNNACQSDLSEEIELAPNKTQCKNLIKYGCDYRSDQLSCGLGVSEAIKNIDFECNIKNIMSFACCLSCKGGINTATSAGGCDMHKDNTLPGLAQEFCCEKFLNPKTIESATESIASSEKPMDAVIAMLEERLSNSSVNKKPVELDNSTESVTSASPTSITSTTATPAADADADADADAAADADADTIPTSTTTTEAPDTDATPTQTRKPTIPATEITTTTTTPSTTTTTTPSTTTITFTQTSTTSPTTISTTTEPSSTATEKSTTPVTETTSTSDSTPILSTQIPTAATDELKPLTIVTRDIDQPEGYKLLGDENNLYQKIDAGDRSKADYLVILKENMKIENDGDYKDFKLMNLTLRSNIKCDWRFNFEKTVAENDGETLDKSNFFEKLEGSSYILLLAGKVKPQTVQYSVECNIKKYKYYKYQVYLNFNNPKN